MTEIVIEDMRKCKYCNKPYIDPEELNSYFEKCNDCNDIYCDDCGDYEYDKNNEMIFYCKRCMCIRKKECEGIEKYCNNFSKCNSVPYRVCNTYCNNGCYENDLHNLCYKDCFSCKKQFCDYCSVWLEVKRGIYQGFCYKCLLKERFIRCEICDNRIQKHKYCYRGTCENEICMDCINKKFIYCNQCQINEIIMKKFPTIISDKIFHYYIKNYNKC